MVASSLRFWDVWLASVSNKKKNEHRRLVTIVCSKINQIKSNQIFFIDPYYRSNIRYYVSIKTKLKHNSLLKS